MGSTTDTRSCRQEKDSPVSERYFFTRFFSRSIMQTFQRVFFVSFISSRKWPSLPFSIHSTYRWKYQRRLKQCINFYIDLHLIQGYERLESHTKHTISSQGLIVFFSRDFFAVRRRENGWRYPCTLSLSLSWKNTWNDSSAQSTPSLSYIFVAVMSFLLTPVFMAGDGLPCERMSDTKTAKWRWSSSLSFTDSIKSWEKRKEARETRRERSRQTLDINCIASLDRQDPVHERETGRRERERNQDKREEGLP